MRSMCAALIRGQIDEARVVVACFSVLAPRIATPCKQCKYEQKRKGERDGHSHLGEATNSRPSASALHALAALACVDMFGFLDHGLVRSRWFGS